MAMSDYFDLAKYQAPYIAARNELARLKVRIEGLRTEMIHGEDPEAAQEELQAAEAQLPELEEKVEDLWSLYTTGHHRKEYAPAEDMRRSPYGPFNTGHHEKPYRRFPR